MTPEFVQKLIEQLMKTGEILATEGFRLAVKQIYTYAILDLIWGGIFLVAGIILLILGIKKINEWSEDGFMPVILIGGIFTIIGTVVSLSSIRFFMNPEWYAIKLLIETFLRK